MAGSNYLLPPSPMNEDLTAGNNAWTVWTQMVADLLSGVVRLAPVAVTPAASPWTFQFTGAGRALLVLDGTVSLVELSRNGVTFYKVASGPGAFPLVQGDFLRVTYAALASATLISQ